MHLYIHRQKEKKKRENSERENERIQSVWVRQRKREEFQAALKTERHKSKKNLESKRNSGKYTYTL